ncbi:phospholipid hydroperoxide glutathione peroxidase, mitochondrial-like [Oryzias latipes]|uniref:phospholipid hydroperoxide glutathione peroxidase, mitochondrial-like n=1 Tax=Oryzias latipes TaxID=8090 RepID=UPI0009DADA6D|nr:phospholipid hydroperoxide glutathione peroxidase, mitochondrial-like [Oryzias latipes]
MIRVAAMWLRPVVLLGVLGTRGIVRTMCAQKEDWKKAASIYEFSAIDIDGNDVSLEKYRGYVCIIVNVSSECKLTDVNYTQLTAMHTQYAEQGLRILAFPCNQFGSQEPGTEAEIKEFAKGYNAEFDLFSKIDVNNDTAHPLWKWMKEQPEGKGFMGNFIKWNFTKFLIDKNGQVVKRYAPKDEPFSIKKDLKQYL